MTAIFALRQALFLVLVLAAPVLVCVLAVGIVTGVFSTLTQIRDRSISAVPKLLAALAALALAGPWMGAKLLAFVRAVLEAVPLVGRS